MSDSKNTHIGIGFAFNKEQVKVVEFVTEKPIMVNKLIETPDQGVEVRGIVLNKDVGLYAARIASIAKMNKDVKVIGPQHISYDKSDGMFVLKIPGPLDNIFYCNEDLKLVQFYIRRS